MKGQTLRYKIARWLIGPESLIVDRGQYLLCKGFLELSNKTLLEWRKIAKGNGALGLELANVLDEILNNDGSRGTFRAFQVFDARQKAEAILKRVVR